MRPVHRADHEPRIHVDPLSRRPVFVAPQRGGKPDDRELAATCDDAADPAAWCPFCAGNEHRTPPEVVRAPADDASAWHARIVPNRYPIAGDRDPTMLASVDTPRPAHGVHDVVVESPRHDRSILDIAPESWRDVWRLCQRRLAMLAERPDVAWATVFKNSGPRAGASLEHVHSQLVGVDLVPPAVHAELAALRDRRDPFGHVLAEARAAGRVVATVGDLVALVPPAPRQPFETWIVVADRERHFHATTAARVADVADLSRNLVGRLARVAPRCDYNWWLHQAPFDRADGPAAEAWHWHLEILPRLTELAGFELGTGCHITTMSPEEAARRLREAVG